MTGSESLRADYLCLLFKISKQSINGTHWNSTNVYWVRPPALRSFIIHPFVRIYRCWNLHKLQDVYFRSHGLIWSKTTPKTRGVEKLWPPPVRWPLSNYVGVPPSGRNTHRKTTLSSSFGGWIHSEQTLLKALLVSPHYCFVFYPFRMEVVKVWRL